MIESYNEFTAARFSEIYFWSRKQGGVGGKVAVLVTEWGYEHIKN